MDTMVARCSSDRLSVGVDPGAELEPGNTKGAAKSGGNHVDLISEMGPISKSWTEACSACDFLYIDMFTCIIHMPHHPVHSSIDASVPRVIHSLPAGLERKSHLTQLRHCGLIQHWS